MFSLNKEKKIALIGVILYMVIMGTGMYTLYHVNGVEYKDPRMVNTLLFFEIILTILTVFMAKKYFSWNNIVGSHFEKKQIKWLVPSFLILIAMLGNVFFSLDYWSSDNMKLLPIIAVTTFMVGFSEELMYRGIVLNTFLKTSSKIASVFISTILFSLLHIVNVLGGLSGTEMMIQLLMTFLFGLLLALVFMRVKSIIPLIIFHWLWDFSLISSTLIKGEHIIGLLSSIHLLIEIIVIMILLYYLIKKGSTKKI